MSNFDEAKRLNENKLSAGAIALRRSSVVNRIERNPLYRNYVNHISGPNVKNTEPWHALGERLNAAALCVGASTDLSVGVYGLKADAASWREQVMVETAEWILNATPFLWSSEIEKLADSAPMPRHVVSPTVLCARSMFWSRETCYVAEGGLIETNWIAMKHDETGVSIAVDLCDVEHRDGPVKKFGVALSRINYGATWPTDFKQSHPEDFASIDRLLKRCAFLNSPYIDRETGRLPRHLRRQLERSGEPPERSDEPIHVVKLRHRVAEPPKPTEPGAGVDWKHKFWVKGHYRAQWYPSEQAHRVIYIDAFLKGDPNLPLLEKVYAVVR